MYFCPLRYRIILEENEDFIFKDYPKINQTEETLTYYTFNRTNDIVTNTIYSNKIAVASVIRNKKRYIYANTPLRKVSCQK